MGAENAIELRNLQKSFGTKRAVQGVDLTIPQGSLHGLIGPNGAGKTTTIRMIMSIIFPDSGDIRVLGRASAVESKDRIGYLPEERGLYKKMKVAPFLAYIAKLKGIDGAGLDRHIAGWLDRLGLGDCGRKRCEELSKGMQQKVQFIAAVVHNPDLIILDEPFSGLDPVNSRILRSLIEEQHKQGKTIIFSTHQMSQAEALCDRVVMIHQGRKVLDNTPAEIRNQFDPRAIVIEPLLLGAEDVSSYEVSLRGLPGVSAVSTTGRNITVQLKTGVDATQSIPAIAASVPCRRIEVVRPTLEDVFIEIVTNTANTEEERQELAALARAMTASRSGDSSGD